MSWSKLIHDIQKDMRLSEKDIEHLTKVHAAIINRLRSGLTTKPYPSTIGKLEKGLNIKIDDSDPENITYHRLDSMSADHNSGSTIVQSNNNSVAMAQNTGNETEYLKELIKEKDARIKLLEQLVEALQKKPKGNT